MKYLFDCDALLALGYAGHTNHSKVEAFYVSKVRAGFLTTPITELAFVRIGVNAGYFSSIANAQFILRAIKKASDGRISLIADDLGADDLPAYVTKAKDTTDGHLFALAKRHGFKLATLDTGIPGAELIS